jgi:hypothetical protein
MAEAKVKESNGAPFAFRCECSEGRAKASVGIPLWSSRYAKGYEVLKALKGPDEAVSPPADPVAKHSKEVAAIEPEPVSDVRKNPEHVIVTLTPAAFAQLHDCIGASSRGIPLQNQPTFGRLVSQFGKDAVLAAVRSIRLQDSQPKVISQ